MSILVTGGAGYIGSHTCLVLLHSGQEVVVYENFSNGHLEALQGVQALTQKSLKVVEGDLHDTELLRSTLEKHHCSAVIHFAGLKAVGNSVRESPL